MHIWIAIVKKIWRIFFVVVDLLFLKLSIFRLIMTYMGHAECSRSHHFFNFGLCFFGTKTDYAAVSPALPAYADHMTVDG